MCVIQCSVLKCNADRLKIETTLHIFTVSGNFVNKTSMFAMLNNKPLAFLMVAIQSHE